MQIYEKNYVMRIVFCTFASVNMKALTIKGIIKLYK